ncbi:MAG: LemA family protein [Candidatus Latescibacteria bacterium]|nr:LemA family protein [Candidatus Latescibacterota bacterium]NIM22298.1 LemA family protein [Candidatus Latescibacterota bacterium]NIM66127.1 LemA family protein [Candidatus Latescibacterota bacterium]NIO02535.1 LemA family protein [Candidatus Latescibacterota bacterium]NIO29449.1 LemA family protein [Candidatus Latescibacterota bacterium]
MAGLIIILAIVALVIFYFIGIYNALIRLRNRVKNAWSQIDVQLKRRHDLIPNLVETAKGYVKHERETLENVTEARSRAMGANSIGDKSRAESDLSGALSRFLLVVENYPDLKANQNFLALQEELTSTENKIAFARQGYNDQVLFFNNKIQMFPSNIIAQTFNFNQEEFFEIEDKAEKEVPKVSFTT